MRTAKNSATTRIDSNKHDLRGDAAPTAIRAGSTTGELNGMYARASGGGSSGALCATINEPMPAAIGGAIAEPACS